MIGGRSQPQNKLRNLRYILNKTRYIQFSGHQDPYIIIHGPFVPLGTHRKVIRGHSPLGMNFGILGTSFTKFGTFLTKFGISLKKSGTSNS